LDFIQTVSAKVKEGGYSITSLKGAVDLFYSKSVSKKYSPAKRALGSRLSK
jgi:hypothetical protein